MIGRRSCLEKTGSNAQALPQLGGCRFTIGVYWFEPVESVLYTRYKDILYML